MIGPIAHIKSWNNALQKYIWSPDWSRPGTIDRCNAEWELNNGYLHDWRGKFPGL